MDWFLPNMEVVSVVMPTLQMAGNTEARASVLLSHSRQELEPVPSPPPTPGWEGRVRGPGRRGSSRAACSWACAGSMHGLGGLEAEMGFSWTLISSGKTAPEPHLGKPHPSLTFRV